MEASVRVPVSRTVEPFSNRESLSGFGNKIRSHYNYVAKLDTERFDCLLCVSASGRLTNQNQSSKADIPLKPKARVVSLLLPFAMEPVT
jgi:hypothetical protein